MELLLGIAVEMIASEAWGRIKDRLRTPDPTWTDIAARRLEPDLGRGLTTSERQGITNWLSRPDVFAALATSTLETLQGDVDRVVSALEYELGPPSAETQALAAAIAREVVLHATELVDPLTAATLAAHRSVKTDLTDLKLGQAVLLDAINERRSQPPILTSGRDQLDAAALARLPAPIVVELQAALTAGAEAATMLSWLQDRSRIASNLDVLIAEQPSWLASSVELWAALAAAAEAYGTPEQVVRALDRAAELAPGRRSEFLSRAALAAARDEQRARAGDLLERARSGATDADGALIDVVEAAIDEDVERLPALAERALQVGAPCADLIRAWLGQARAQTGDLDGAVEILDAGMDQVMSQAGLLLVYADVLLRRAVGQSGVDRIKDLQLALRIALQARQLRRTWGGDSTQATAVACQASFSLQQWADVIKMGTPADDGATESEANHPEVRQLVALAQHIEGGDPPPPDTPFERAWFLGLSLSRDATTRAEAVEQLEHAANLASNDGELDRAQRSLAHLGHSDLPRLDEVRVRDPDHAELLVALAEACSDRLAEAAGRLRPLAGRNVFAALQLAETYRLQNKPEESANLLAHSGQRFSDPRLLVLAARHYLHLGRIDRFSLCIELAMPLAPGPSLIRREIRWLQVEAAVKRQDAAAIEAATRMAIDEGDDRSNLRWLRTEVLAVLNQLKQAWNEIRRLPTLVADTEPRAILFLQLLIRQEPSALELMVDVLDRFPDAHDVHATGISLFLAFGAADDREAADVEAMQAHITRFVETYPDSSVLRSQDVSTDDPDELREQMRQMLNPDPERDRLRHRIAEHALLGQVPMALVASVFGRSRLEVLLNGTGVGFTTVPLGQVLEEQVQAAVASLDQPVVVDVSTLVAMTFLHDLWPSVLAAFSSISIAPTTVAEIADSTHVKPSAGNLRWDHRQDTMVFTTLSDKQLDAISTQRARLSEWAGQLQVAPAGDRTHLPGGEALREPGNSKTWDDSVTAAHAKSCQLLCDDVGLATFARSVGVPAFGSFALLLALAKAGRIASDQVDDLVTRLYEAQADDLPLSPVRLAALAIDRQWSLTAAIHPMSRPAYWRDLQTAASGFAATIDGFRHTEHAAGRTLYAATVGVIRAVVTGSPLPIVGQLFAQAMLSLEAEPAVVADLVAAIRAACDERELADPLPFAVRAILEDASSALEPGDLGAFVTSAFAALEQEDRTTVASIVLA